MEYIRRVMKDYVGSYGYSIVALNHGNAVEKNGEQNMESDMENQIMYVLRFWD